MGDSLLPDGVVGGVQVACSQNWKHSMEPNVGRTEGNVAAQRVAGRVERVVEVVRRACG